MKPDYLPDIYVEFRKKFPAVATAHDQLAAEAERAGPLDEKTARIVKLALAVGALSEGAVRSNVRKALAKGVTKEEIEHVMMLALTTKGFPSMIASWQWALEVLDREAGGSSE